MDVYILWTGVRYNMYPYTDTSPFSLNNQQAYALLGKGLLQRIS
jgi:hypothetical protein